MKQQELIPHLFRTEFTKITSVLCKLFGIEHLESAEDIASDTFLMAFETWTFNGIPKNPTAWLYLVAKNKAKNYIKRTRLFSEIISGQLTYDQGNTNDIEINLSDKNISDSQLQMMFAICHPCISSEAQITLSLRILCGFGIEEIANAFFTNKEVINKRLFRAKERLRLENIKIEFPDKEQINKRLENVLTTLYLIFNEGYYSESKEVILREDFCLEAMRLTHLLINNEQTNQPETNALLALMCFHSSRFASRKNTQGEIILYQDQDESRWDQELIHKGGFYLHRSSKGKKFSKYHLEASIAYWHTIKEESMEKWNSILQLFNYLLEIDYSPIAALNRIYALSKVKGTPEAILEAEKLNLTGNHFYFTLLGELYSDINNPKARELFRIAHELAKTQADKNIIQNKIDKL